MKHKTLLSGIKTLLSGILCALLMTPALLADRFEVVRQTDKVTVKLDDELFTEYLTKSGAKPVLWPVIGPTGDAVTRGFPMKEASADERKDHVHHRSFWFTHGAVNDTDFWLEGRDTGGNIVHREFGKVEGGATAVIETTNDWVDRHGKTVCHDERTLTFGVDGETRYIDFDITIKAGDEPVTFGDTKEGSFGVRVAGTMKVEAENGGTIVNSHGQKNGDAWGKQASWVDYSGPVGNDDEIVGVAILNHPKSFRYPSYWHVRTYGLFAANVFGLHHFKGDNSINAAHTLKPGDAMTFHYRVLVHDGDESIGKVAEAFDKYSATKKK